MPESPSTPPADSRYPGATPIPCAVCGGEETRTLYVKEGYPIARCARCGLVYATPRAPAARILGRYSRDYFWHEYLPSLGVVEGRFHLERFDARYRPLLDAIAARVSGRRLLEVGCGAGFFLKSAERAGWSATGIELSEEAAGFAEEHLHLRVHRVRAEEMPLPPASIDAAVMLDVIEHLFDPRAVLQAIAHALAPGGLLVVATPNFDSLSRQLLGPAWAVLNPLEHVYYFHVASLRRLLAASGFTDVRSLRTAIAQNPQETLNFRYTHAPDGRRARLVELLVTIGGMPLARLVQLLGRQDALLCFARRR